MTFLIVLLALVLLEAYSDLGSVQPDQWLRKWHSSSFSDPIFRAIINI